MKVLHSEEVKLTDLEALAAEQEEKVGIDSIEDFIKHTYALNKIEEEIEELKELKKAAIEFYDKRIEKAKRAKDFISSKLIAYIMNARQGRKVPLPHGTYYVQKREVVVFDEDPKALAEKFGFIRQVPKPDLAALKQAVKEGQIKEGAHVEIVPTLAKRKPETGETGD